MEFKTTLTKEEQQRYIETTNFLYNNAINYEEHKKEYIVTTKNCELIYWKKYVFIKSYDTIVGVISKNEESTDCYVFGKYSRTTSNHITRAIRKTGATTKTLFEVTNW